MKIRNGFVSNSSSSSFVCDVCGSTESGMDASPHDFDMETCCGGHTFCMDHASGLPEPTPSELRSNIKARIDGMTWLKDKNRNQKYEELENTPDDEIQDYWNDNYDDEGVSECQCPICSMSALNHDDAFSYLKLKYGISNSDILVEIKGRFPSYKDFKSFIHPPEKK